MPPWCAAGQVAVGVQGAPLGKLLDQLLVNPRAFGNKCSYHAPAFDEHSRHIVRLTHILELTQHARLSCCTNPGPGLDALQQLE